MALAAHAPVSRVATAAGALVLCMPLVLGALIVSGGGSSALPAVLAFAVTSFAVAAAAQARLRALAAAASLSLFLVLASAGVGETRIETQAELGAARFGFPFAFVEAELSATPPLPYEATWNPWEDPAQLFPGRFLLSYVLVLTAAAGALLLAQWSRRGRTAVSA